ncbi:MAG: SRPBCC domain-containing protein [Caldilineaceae bacterium]
MTNQPTHSNASVTVTKLYNHPPQELFAAWTNIESLKQWMCPEGGQVSFAAVDLRVGGSYRIDMQFGAEVIVHHGVYREITPPEKLVFTWISANTRRQETVVTIQFARRGAQTELTLTHERFPDAESAQAHSTGWHSIFIRLEKVLT